MDGGWSDRLRRVDPRIWDALLALGVVAVDLLDGDGLGHLDCAPGGCRRWPR